MALKDDYGRALTSADILSGNIKSRISRNISFTPSLNSQKWVYKKHTVGLNPLALFADDFFIGTSDQVDMSDEVLWLSVKHSGYLNNVGAKTSNGVMINMNAKSPLFNGTSGNGQNNIVLAPGELYISKLNGVVINDLIAGTCELGGDIPTAQGTSNAIVHIAAIIRDVSE